MRKSILLAPAALAFALTACGSGDTTEAAATNGAKIEAIKAPESKNWSDVITKTEQLGYVMGNPDAPIKLVEYMSITCSHCKDFGEQAFDTIRDNYVASGRVSFEVRNFVRDPLDLTAALLSRCGGEAPYFPLTKQALSNQEDMFAKAQGMGDERYAQIMQTKPEQRFFVLAQELGLIDFFKQRGISEDQAKACLADTKTAQALMDNTEKAVNELKIQGTPAFLINGSVIEGTSWPLVETKLKEAGAR